MSAIDWHLSTQVGVTVRDWTSCPSSNPSRGDTDLEQWCYDCCVQYNFVCVLSSLASLVRYNQDIVRINTLVSEEAGQTEGVHFLHHRGFWTYLDFLGSDGVHLRFNKRWSAPNGTISDCRIVRYMEAIRPVLFKYNFIIPFMHYLSNSMVPYLKLVT